MLGGQYNSSIKKSLIYSINIPIRLVKSMNSRTDSSLTLVKFSKGNHIRIPIYQRNYNWKKQNCKQLLQDIYRLMENLDEKKRHFTGAVIFTNESMDRVIIDGQQRITTFHLILIAVRDAIKDGSVSSNDHSTLKKICNLLGEEHSILIPCGKDNDAYQELYNGEYNNDWSRKEYGTTNLWKNYDYLKEDIIHYNSGENYGEKILQALKGLWVVPIVLKENDDPQAAFESINTTGLKLDDADCIRNFIMMNQKSDTQEKIYKEYWIKIEEYLGDKIVDFFID